MTYIPTVPFTMRIPEPLLKRARAIILDRNMKGGVTRLICESLEGTLDEMEKVPQKFETVWTRLKGYEPQEGQKVACYGGRYRQQVKVGDPIYYPKDWFTLTELLQHYLVSQWDRSTAALIVRQQREWLTRGQEMIDMPLKPPGWTGYPSLHPGSSPSAAPTASGWSELELEVCEWQDDPCTRKDECRAARACVLAEAEREKTKGFEE